MKNASEAPASSAPGNPAAAAETQGRPDSVAASGASATPARPQPRTGAVSGVLPALAFFRDPGFAQKRFAQNGNVVATSLLGQVLVFIQGARAIAICWPSRTAAKAGDAPGCARCIGSTPW